VRRSLFRETFRFYLITKPNLMEWKRTPVLSLSHKVKIPNPLFQRPNIRANSFSK
jgi:hypothetical protein